MAGFAAFGTKFMRGDGAASEEFTTIGEATDISGPSMQRDTIEVTSHDSPNGFREYVGGLVDGDEVSFTVNYDPTKHNVLKSDFTDPQPRNYLIVLPDSVDNGGEWAFSAFITGFDMNFPHDDKMSADMSFKVSGEPTYTAGPVPSG